MEEGRAEARPLSPYISLPPKLPQISEHTTCKTRLAGKCSDTSCRKEHGVRLVTEAEALVHQILPQNTVLHQPRCASRSDKLFDDKSPLICGEPKHDNDHADITKIKILPTTDEIISLAPVYMPKKDEAFTVQELLDGHFRHLRYNDTESTIDACYDGLQRAIWPDSNPQFSYETSRGLRYVLLKDVKFEGIQFHQFNGAMFRLSFDCPPSLRGNAFHKSSILEKDKMVSLLALHDESKEINIVHLEVKERQSTDATSSIGNRSRAMVQVCIADKSDISKVRQTTLYAKDLIKAQLFLVDHSNVIPVSFMPVLERLQESYKQGTFPFANIITPRPDLAQIHLQVPEYASKPGFRYNFSCLKDESQDATAEQLSFQPMPGGVADEETINNLKKYTTLDDGQAVALYENLSRCLAFTQGPPGTGKTFLGVAEAKVILKSQPKASSASPSKPLVVICMTNHALDDFVESLIKRGMDKVVRLGSRSTNEWMGKYQLRRVLAKKKLPFQEYKTLRKFGTDNDALVSFATEWSEELTEGPAFRLLQDFLYRNEPDVLAEFDRLDGTADTSVELKYLTKSSAGFTFRYWLDGGDLDSLALLLDEGTSTASSTTSDDYQSLSSSSKSTTKDVDWDLKVRSPKVIAHRPLMTQVQPRNDRSIWKEAAKDLQANGETKPGLPTLQKALEEFAERSHKNANAQKLWSLNLEDRKSLLATWMKSIDQVELCEAFAELHRRHQELQAKRWKWTRLVDARMVQELGTQIVALTASGAARNWEFLNALAPQTYIIEEASELTEPITIAGLVPSMQHLIKIGDPLQLRPHVAEQVLSSERDASYKLDESLFERLMRKVPYSKLNMQRRAHPDMAAMLRGGDYPYLVDHEKTITHPGIPGFKHRMFWLDHNRIEDQPDPGSALAKSCSNKYEVRFICEAVKYLIQRQGFSMKQITILTPYNGQVALFVRSLRGFCNVLLNDEDKQSLVEMGMLSEKDLQSQGIGANAVPLDSLIRVTTVDNYQGEENDIIFLSTVRSNTANKTGFLGNQNRINVAISRARNAFYVVGNAKLLEENVDGWRQVTEVFKERGHIGQELPLMPCEKHNLNTDIVVDIQHPGNFKLVPDCKALCGAPLSCGHNCGSECHAEEMHADGRLKCLQPCNKTLDCGHQCKRLCYEECGPCQQPVQQIVLDCGHKTKVECSAELSNLQCTTVVGAYKDAKCGHIRFKLCSTGLTPCKELCSKLRPCGHDCQNLCCECEHKECDQVCGKLLDCGHSCQSSCHFGLEGPCPPCQQPCRKSCDHGPCRYKCSEMCNPCTKDGLVTHCKHHEPAILCSMPGSRLPCTQPCELSAPCGLHQCQGLCGEECPEVCDVCEDEPRREQLFSLPCKCVFKVQELDEKFELNKLYKMDGSEVMKFDITGLPGKDILKCPSCSASVEGTHRYALCAQLYSLNDLFGSLCSPLGLQLWRMMKFINHRQYDMFDNMSKTVQQIKAGPLTVKHNQAIIAKMLGGAREALVDVKRFRDWDIKLVQDAILAFTASLGSSTSLQSSPAGFNNTLPILGIPHLPYLLRSERVVIRIKFLIAKFLWDVHAKVSSRRDIDSHLALFLKVVKAEATTEVRHLIQNLDTAIIQCEASNLKRLEVEFIIQKASVVGLLRLMGRETGEMSTMLNHALSVCAEYKSASLLSSNVSQAFRMLKEGMVSIRLDDAMDLPKNSKTEAQLLWKSLARFERGSLAACSSGHYYSSTYFAYCPECG